MPSRGSELRRQAGADGSWKQRKGSWDGWIFKHRASLRFVRIHSQHGGKLSGDGASNQKRGIFVWWTNIYRSISFWRVWGSWPLQNVHSAEASILNKILLHACNHCSHCIYLPQQGLESLKTVQIWPPVGFYQLGMQQGKIRWVEAIRPALCWEDPPLPRMWAAAFKPTVGGGCRPKIYITVQMPLPRGVRLGMPRIRQTPKLMQTPDL